MDEEATLEKFELLSTKWRESRELVKELTKTVDTLKSQLRSKTPGIDTPEPPLASLADFDTRYAELQKENQILNQLIKQYEGTLEIVMGKFRNQAQSIQKEKHELQLKLGRVLEEERETNNQLRLQNTTLQSQLDSCLRVMRDAISVDDTDMEILLTSVMKENEGLREMLNAGGSAIGVR